MTISLPSTLKAKVDALVSQGDYGTASEYVRELIRQDLKRRIQEELEQRLLESLDSGKATPLTKKDFDNVRDEVRKKAATRGARSQ